MTIVKRLIVFSYLDVVLPTEGFQGLAWADALGRRQLPDETLTFTTFDGCGKELDKQIFKGLGLVSHLSDEFDYSSSEVACQNIVVRYKYVHIDFLDCPSPLKKLEWKLHFEGQNNEYDVLLGDRPKMTIEETGIPYLNSKIWLPGKCNWHDLEIIASKEIRQYILEKFITNNKPATAVLTLYEDGAAVEKWKLNDAWVKSADFSEKECNFILKFTNVHYENLLTPTMPHNC